VIQQAGSNWRSEISSGFRRSIVAPSKSLAGIFGSVWRADRKLWRRSRISE